MIFLLSSYLGIYFTFLVFFKSQVLTLLQSNLPFREFYIPTILGFLFTYINPLFMGFFTGRYFYQSKRTYLNYLNLSLFFGLINYFAFIINSSSVNAYWFNYHLQLYFLMLFPLLFFFGCLPYWLKFNYSISLNRCPPLTLKHNLVAAALGLIMFTLNCLPLFRSPYLVGADIYYHAAMTQRTDSIGSIIKSPFFLESRNYYYSLVYFLVSGFSRVTHIPILQSWVLLPAVCSLIFIYFFYLSAVRITRSSVAGLLASLFVFTFNQILWYDPSLRIFSYTFFSLFLYSFVAYLNFRRFIYLFNSIILFGLTAASHPEIAIHIVLIILVYSFLLLILHRPPKLAVSLFKFIKTQFINQKFYTLLSSAVFTKYRSLLILLSLYWVIFFSRIYQLLTNFPISRIMIFNEIPFSLFQPYGLTSFIVFLFLPLGLLKILRRPDNITLLLVSIAALFPVIIFYFTYLWSLYHRYFPETAYLSLALISSVAIADLLKRLNFSYRLVFNLIVISFLVLTIYPKFNFINAYSQSVAFSVNSLIPYLNYLKNNTRPDSTILLSPDDMLNRYIPFYSNRFIIAGSNAKSPEHQWQILSFCNGPFGDDCTARLNLADNLFNNPTPQTLSQITSSYHIDYLFFDPVKYPSLDNLLKDNLHFKPLVSISPYIIYQLSTP